MTKMSIVGFALLLVAAPAFAGDTHKLTITPPPAKHGERAEARVKVEPLSGFHINVDYPTKLKIVAPDGVTLEKDVQKGSDAARFDKDGAEFAVAFVSADSGKRSFTGELRFAVCTDSNCSPKVETIAFDVDVK